MVSGGAVIIKTNHVAHNRLIDQVNPLLGDTDSAITDHQNGVRPITQDEAATFLASSSLCHAIDGWIYLAHAIDSFLKGDKGISVHLAYYAELRGAMSFLSREGIGTLNHHHICILETGQVSKYNNNTGTHKFAWGALDFYIQSNAKAKDEILRVFSYLGKDFIEWQNAIPNASSIMSDQVVKDWLRQWSFDINKFNFDRTLRNEVSYRPKKLQDNSITDIAGAFRSLSSFWYLLEPKNTERFSMLDQYLLKKFLWKIHGHIQVVLSKTIDFDVLLEDTFKNLKLTLLPSQKSFFRSPNDHDLFLNANNTALDPVLGINPISIIARATLLLRLSIGYSSNNLVSAGVTKSELNFFLNNIGVNNGFWEGNNIPDDFADLWDQVSDSISDVDSWLNGRTTAPSLKEVNNELSYELSLFKQINRASLWGIRF